MGKIFISCGYLVGIPDPLGSLPIIQYSCRKPARSLQGLQIARRKKIIIMEKFNNSCVKIYN